MYSFHQGYQKVLGSDISGIPGMSNGIQNAKPMGELISLKGKTAIVTGGAMGMGLCTVNRLCEAGADVVIVDVADEYAEKALEYLSAQNYNVKYFKADLRDLKQIQAAVDFARKEFGKIDILVNNAAVWSHRTLEEITEDSWDEIVDVNLKACMFFTQAAAEVMEAQGTGGKIVNIASVAGLSADRQPLMFEYVASKSAVIALTKSLAKKMKSINVNINCVVPGGMITPGAINTVRSEAAQALKMPPCPVSDPDEVARVVYMLTTDISNFMQGAVVTVDGGDSVHVQ